MQRTDADVESQLGSQAFQGEVGLFGQSCSQCSFVATIERHLFRERRTGGDLAGGLKATNELANPFSTDGVLATEISELHTSLKVHQHPLPQINRIRFHL